MANRLEKLVQVSYTAGRPYIPAQPERCWWETRYYPGRYVIVSYTTETKLAGGGTLYATASWFEYRAGEPYQVQVCSPAVAGQTAIPAGASYSAIVGWNSGARSAEPLVGDGYFEFSIPRSAVAVVAGLAPVNSTTQPNEVTHGIQSASGVASVIESGAIVASVTEPFDSGLKFRINRSGTTVTYTYGDWSYVSAVPSYDEAVYLDAALYYSGDAVNDPVLGLAADNVGYAAGTLRPLDGLASNYDYAIDGGYGQAFGWLQPLSGEADCIVTNVHAASGFLPALDGLMTDMEIPYGQASGTLPALTGYANSGFFAPEFVYAYGVLPALSGTASALIGEIGEVEAVMPALTGLASNYPMPYGQAAGTLRALTGGAQLILPVMDKPKASERLFMSDYFFAPLSARETIREGFQLSDSVSGRVGAADVFLDWMFLSDEYTVVQTVRALLEDVLLIAGGHAPGSTSIQYAVNALTGALSTYEGYDFAGFAATGGDTYAVRADGLYRLRAGDDDGQPITVDIDFGADGFGTANSKTIEAVYVGMATDGEVFLHVNADGEQITYQVLDRDHTMRALLGRGMTGRRWNLRLEVVDATELELDMMELLVTLSRSRRTR